MMMVPVVVCVASQIINIAAGGNGAQRFPLVVDKGDNRFTGLAGIGDLTAGGGNVIGICKC